MLSFIVLNTSKRACVFLMSMLLATALFGCASPPQNTFNISKPPQDNREYQYLELENQLKVMLVSDPDIKTPAVALAVGVGSYQNPMQQQGLAHYLEHMIFTGSDKYQSLNPLMTHVRQHGGFSNAYTSADHTGYFFQVEKQGLEQALAIFSDSIKAPLFNKQATEKELSAVHSEWHGRHQHDGYVVYRAGALTANPNHPSVMLSVGNKDTLHDKPNSNLHQELLSFYQQYYSANIMNLVMVTDKPLAQMKQLAQQYFASLPNHNIKRPQNTIPYYDKNSFGKHIHVKTNVKVDSLRLEFELPVFDEKWRNQSSSYLSYLFNNAEPSSLESVLKQQGLIDSFRLTINTGEFELPGSAFAAFELTEKGVTHKHLIIRSFFDLVEKVKQQGINSDYEADVRRVLDNKLIAAKPSRPLMLARDLANKLFYLEPQNVLTASFQFSGIDQTLLHDILDSLNPSKMRVWHISQNEIADTPIPYAQGQYASRLISSKEIADWQTPSQLAFALPEILKRTLSENDYSVTQLPVAKPQLIDSGNGFRTLFGQSQYFSDKEGYLKSSIINNFTIDSAENFVNASLVSRFLQQAVSSIASKYHKLYNVRLNISSAFYGYPNINIMGPAYTHQSLYQQILNQYLALTFNDVELQRYISQWRDSLANNSKRDLPAMINYSTHQHLKRSWELFSREELAEALERVDLATIKDMHHRMISANFIDTFAFGHYDQQAIIELNRKARELLGKHNGAENWNFTESFTPVSNQNMTLQVTSDHRSGAAYKQMRIHPNKDEAVKIQLGLLNQLMSTAFFTSLRTEQEMGYRVGSFIDSVHDYPAIGWDVISNTHSLDTIHTQVEEFISQFGKQLADIDEEEINSLKAARLSQLQQTPRDVYAEFSPFIGDWNSEQFAFDKQERIEGIIHATTKQTLIDLYQQLVFEQQGYKLVVKVQGLKDDDK